MVRWDKCARTISRVTGAYRTRLPFLDALIVVALRDVGKRSNATGAATHWGIHPLAGSSESASYSPLQ